jgi:type 1 glutamine amidotransferase
VQKFSAILAFLGLTILPWAALPASAAEPVPINVLLITGDDVAPAHQWREQAEATREVLVASGRFNVKVCEDPLILESETALQAYDVIVFTLFNRTVPMITDKAKENLLNFVKSGKGFFVQHLASASFAKWDEFGKLCGRKWIMGVSGHGPRSVFEAKVVAADHPITRGLQSFQADDELYSKLQGDAPITVLVEAYSDWSKKVEPLLFVRPYGQGRVVHNAFGHDRQAIVTPDVAKLIVRGVEWAATGKVESPAEKKAEPKSEKAQPK